MAANQVDFWVYTGSVKPKTTFITIWHQNQFFSEVKMAPINQQACDGNIWHAVVYIPSGDTTYKYSLEEGGRFYGSTAYTEDRRRLMKSDVFRYRDVFDNPKCLKSKETFTGKIQLLLNLLKYVRTSNLEIALRELKQINLFSRQEFESADNVKSMTRLLSNNMNIQANENDGGQLLLLGVLLCRLANETSVGLKDLKLGKQRVRNKLKSHLQSLDLNNLEKDDVQIFHSLAVMLLREEEKFNWLHLALEYQNIFSAVGINSAIENMTIPITISGIDDMVTRLKQTYEKTPAILDDILQHVPDHAGKTDATVVSFVAPKEQADETSTSTDDRGIETNGGDSKPALNQQSNLEIIELLSTPTASHPLVPHDVNTSEEDPKPTSQQNDHDIIGLTSTSTASHSLVSSDVNTKGEDSKPTLSRRNDNDIIGFTSTSTAYPQLVLTDVNTNGEESKPTHGQQNDHDIIGLTSTPTVSFPLVPSDANNKITGVPIGDGTQKCSGPPAAPNLTSNNNKGTFRFEVVSKYEKLDQQITLCLKLSETADTCIIFHPMITLQHINIGGRIWHYSWIDIRLMYGMKYTYFYKISSETSTFGVSRVNEITEQTTTNLTPGQTTPKILRHVFDPPKLYFRSVNRREKLGQLCFVDTILKSVNDENLNNSLTEVYNMGFPGAHIDSEVQQKILDWIHDHLEKWKTSQLAAYSDSQLTYSDSQHAFSDSQLVFLALILGKVLSANNYLPKKPAFTVDRECAQRMLVAFEIFSSKLYNFPPSEEKSLLTISKYLVQRIGGTWIDIICYFGFLINPKAVIPTKRNETIQPVDGSNWLRLKPVINRICFMVESDRIGITKLLSRIVKHIVSYVILFEFIELCMYHRVFPSVESEPLVFEIVEKFKTLVLAEFLETRLDVLYPYWLLAVDIPELNRLLSVLRILLLKVLLKNQWQTFKVEYIEFFLLQPQMYYETPRTLLAVIRNMFTQTKAQFSSIKVFLQMLQSGFFVQILEEEEQLNAIEECLKFAAPKGSLTTNQEQHDVSIQLMYHILEKVNQEQHFKEQRHFLDRVESMVLSHVRTLPLGMAARQLIPGTNRSISKTGQEYLTNHVKMVLRSKNRNIREDMRDLMISWNMTDTIRVETENQLEIWITLIDMFPSSKEQCSATTTFLLTASGDLDSIVSYSCHWVELFNASGKYATSLKNTLNMRGILVFLDRLISALESGNISLKLFNHVKEKNRDLNILCRSTGTFKSWEKAMEAASSVHDEFHMNICGLDQLRLLVQALNTEIRVEKHDNFREDLIKRQQDQTNGDILLITVKSDKYWGDILQPILPLARSIIDIADSEIFVNICRSVLDESWPDETSATALKTINSSTVGQHVEMRIKTATLGQFVTVIKEECLKIFKICCTSFVQGNMDTKIVTVRILLDGISNTSDMEVEFDRLEDIYKASVEQKTKEALKNVVSLPDLAFKSQQLQTIFETFNVAHGTGKEFDALQMLNNISDMHVQKTSSLRKLNESIKQVQWVDKQFSKHEWDILEQLAYSSELVVFLRSVVDEDLRNLIDAVEEHAEQAVNEAVVSDLIDVQRYIKPLLMLKSPIQVRQFTSAIKSHQEFHGRLPEKLHVCTTNIFSLKHLYENVANRGEMTKEIIHNALEKGLFSFIITGASDRCNATMAYTRDNRQVTYNLDDMNDLRSRALLIVNSRKVNTGSETDSLSTQEYLQEFISDITAVNEIVDITNGLHNAGHFEFRQLDIALGRVEIQDRKRKLEYTYEEWQHMLASAQQQHYFLNYFNSKYLWLLDQFLLGSLGQSRDLYEKASQMILSVNQNANIQKMQAEYKKRNLNKPQDHLANLGLVLNFLGEDMPPPTSFPFKDKYDLTLETTVKPGRVFVAELDVGSSDSVAVLLEIFRNTSNSYPRADQVIFCNEETTMEEIALHLKRCRDAKSNLQGTQLYCLVNVEMLSAGCQFNLIEQVKSLMKTDTNFLLAIICRGGIHHPVIDEFSPDFTHRVSGMTNTEMELCLRSNWDQVEIVTSDLPGMGKTEHVIKEAIYRNMSLSSVHISGIISKGSLVKLFSQQNTSMKTILHVDVAMLSNPSLFDTFMFELIVIGTVYSKTDIYTLGTKMVYIEIANTPQNKLMDSLNVCSIFNRRNLEWQKFDNTLVSMELNSPIQTVCHYLDALKKGTLDDKDIVLTGKGQVSPLSSEDCKRILRNSFSSDEYLSFTIVNTFLSVLADGLRRLSASQYFTVSTLKRIAKETDRKDMRSRFVQSLFDVAKEFSKRSSQTVSSRKHTAADIAKYHSSGEVSAEHMTNRVNAMIKWEGSNHVLIVFHRKDPQTLSVVYRDITKVPTNIKQLFTDQLRKPLSDYNNMSQEELLGLLERACRNTRKPLNRATLTMKSFDKNYALTPDNLLKMMLIHMRVRSSIPVIIMGETGCGKTTLITYLAIVCDIQFHVCNIHAGTSADTIVEFATKLVDAAYKSVKTEIWGFYDEINTCNHLGLLNDIICHRRLNGVMLPINLIFMAACNPYRLRTGNLTTAGLQGKIQIDEQSKLVYRVHPLPESMMDYVWDYGSLGRKDEEKYIRRMITGTSKPIDENQFVDLLKASQDFIREVEGTAYCVSLRDISRCKHLAQWFREQMFRKKKLAATGYSQTRTDDEKELRSQLLALAHCYYSRLTEDRYRKAYLDKMVDVLRTNSWKTVTRRYIETNIRAEQQSILDQMNLPPGTAKNRALRENVFVILVSILNKIPVFVVGKPGCSKSLSMQLIRSNLKGLDSKEEFFKKLPPVYVVSHQGSESSTSEGIKAVFKKAERYERHNTQVCPVVLLDEIGLAEVSRFNPLKILHSLLEPTDRDFPATAVVGISNWALDAAKMNRAVYLSRPEPTIEDLHQTAIAIRNDIEKKRNHSVVDSDLENLAKAYHNYQQQQKHKNFHGLRDYYSMVKYISSMHHIRHQNIQTRVQRGLLRNFGGLHSEDTKRVFKEFTKEMPLVTQQSQHIPVLELISENLRDKFARNLMIITSGDSALTILEQSLRDREHNIIFGSRFEEDNSEEYNYRVLSRIILCMERGITLVLRDLDSIYGSLYDMLNQNYLIVGKKRNCRIALGAYSNPMCLVHEDFRCIVLVDDDKLDLSDPPFLNRFEKQRLNFTDIVDGLQKRAICVLETWMDGITSVEGTNFCKKDMFLGFHRDTLPSLVYFCCESTNNQLDQVSITKSSEKQHHTTESIVEDCKRYLLMVACPDAVFRSFRSNLAKEKLVEVENIFQSYIQLPLHSGIAEFIRPYIKGNHNTHDEQNMPLQFDTSEVGLKFVIYTHTSIHTNIGCGLSSLCKTREEKLNNVNSERQLSSLLRNYWFESEDELFLLRCQPYLDSPKMLLAKCLIDQFKTEYLSNSRNQKPKHVCLIVHIDRNEAHPVEEKRAWHWQFNFLCGWNQVTLDMLNETRPSLKDLKGKEVSEIIVEGLIDSEDLVKEQVLWGFTCLKYTINARSIDSCLELSNSIASNPEVLQCFKPHILKVIDESGSGSQFRGTKALIPNWQIDVSCNASLLYRNGTTVGAMLEKIQDCFRHPLGKVVFFLENASAWQGKLPSSEESTFWKHCLASNTIFDIRSNLIPEPRGLETCVVTNKLLDLRFPFYKVFHDRISSHRERFIDEAKIIAAESAAEDTPDSRLILDILSSQLVKVIKATVPDLEFGSFLIDHLKIFLMDMGKVLAANHGIEMNDTESNIMHWLLEQKVSTNVPMATKQASTIDEAIYTVARWFVSMWLHEDFIINGLKLLVAYIGITGKVFSGELKCISDRFYSQQPRLDSDQTKQETTRTSAEGDMETTRLEAAEQTSEKRGNSGPHKYTTKKTHVDETECNSAKIKTQTDTDVDANDFKQGLSTNVEKEGESERDLNYDEDRLKMEEGHQDLESEKKESDSNTNEFDSKIDSDGSQNSSTDEPLLSKDLDDLPGENVSDTDDNRIRDNEEDFIEEETIDNIIVGYVCEGVLPKEAVIKQTDGLDNWQRKVGLIILLAGQITSEPHILHFLRLCRDFVSVLLPFKIQEEKVVSLAHKGEDFKDPLSTDAVFDFVNDTMMGLMKQPTQTANTTSLEKFLCTFFVRAFESNPDTEVLPRIIRSLVSSDKLIVGFRSVLFSILKTDVGEESASESQILHMITTNPIDGDKLPNVLILDEVLREVSSVDNHLITACADILHDILRSRNYVTHDSLAQISSTDHSILRTMTEAVDVVHHTDASCIQLACAVAFIRAVLDAFAELLKYREVSEFQPEGDLFLLAREINSVLTVKTSCKDRSSALQKYFLKRVRESSDVITMKGKCDVLTNPLENFKGISWQNELLSSRLSYSPMSYVKHYQDVMDAVNKWQKDSNARGKFLDRAVNNQSVRLGLLAVAADMFYFPTTVRSLKDSEKVQAGHLNEQIYTRNFHPTFKRLMKLLLGKQDFTRHLRLGLGSDKTLTEYASVIIHLASVVVSKASRSRGSVFMTCLEGSPVIKSMTLPAAGCPQWSIPATLPQKVIERKQCPSCMYYIVGDVYSTKTRFSCPVCGTNSRHEVVASVEVVETKKVRQHETRYQLRAEETAKVDLVIRSLSPVAYRVTSLIMHASLQVGIEMSLTQEENLHRIMGFQKEGTADALWNEFQSDWCALQSLLSCNVENTALFLHCVIEESKDILTSTSLNCKQIEETLSKKVDDLMKVLPMCQQRFLRASLENIGSPKSGLEQDMKELYPQRTANLPKLLRQRRSVTLEHFEVSALHEIATGNADHSFLCLFLLWQYRLEYLQYLPTLLEWDQLLTEKLSRKIERKEGKKSIEDFLSGEKLVSSEDGREKLRKNFRDHFQPAWNRLKSHWKSLTGEEADFKGMNSDQSVGVCLTESSRISPLQRMISVLQNIQNEFLHQTLDVATHYHSPTLAFLKKSTKVACLPSVPLARATSEIIQYTWKSSYLDFSDINTDYGMGNVISHDFSAVERELTSVLVVNKAFLTSSPDLNTFSYSDELFHASASILKEVEGIVGKHKLPEEVRKAIHSRKQTFTKNMLDLLEVLILFVKKLGRESKINPDDTLDSFIIHWADLLSRSFSTDLLPKTQEKIKLHHIVSLYETLEDTLVDIAIASLHPDYQQNLEKQEEAAVQDMCRQASKEELESALATVSRFVYRYLRSGHKTSPQTTLDSMMRETAGTTLNCDVVARLIPQDLKAANLTDVIRVLKREIKNRGESTQQQETHRVGTRSTRRTRAKKTAML